MFFSSRWGGLFYPLSAPHSRTRSSPSLTQTTDTQAGNNSDNKHTVPIHNSRVQRTPSCFQTTTIPTQHIPLGRDVFVPDVSGNFRSETPTADLLKFPSGALEILGNSHACFFFGLLLEPPTSSPSTSMHADYTFVFGRPLPQLALSSYINAVTSRRVNEAVLQYTIPDKHRFRSDAPIPPTPHITHQTPTMPRFIFCGSMRVCTSCYAGVACFWAECCDGGGWRRRDGHSLLSVAASAVMIGESPAPPPACGRASAKPDATGEQPGDAAAGTESGSSTSPSHLVVLCEYGR